MKYAWISVLFIGSALCPVHLQAAQNNDSSINTEQQIEDLNAEIDNLKIDLENALRNFKEDTSALAKYKSDERNAKQALEKMKKNLGPDKVFDPEKQSTEESKSLAAAQSAADEASNAYETQAETIRDEKNDIARLKTVIFKKSDQLDKLEGISVGSSGVTEKSQDCAEGNCKGGSGGSPSKAKENGWDIAGNIAKAITPAVVGGVGMVMGIGAYNNSYSQYAKSNTAMGYYVAPPNGYMGIIGTALAGTIGSYAAMNGGLYGQGGMTMVPNQRSNITFGINAGVGMQSPMPATYAMQSQYQMANMSHVQFAQQNQAPQWNTYVYPNMSMNQYLQSQNFSANGQFNLSQRFINQFPQNAPSANSFNFP